jgi:hypothetical protein
MMYEVVRLRLEMEKIRLGMTEDSVAMHTSPNTYLYLSRWELGTATKSLRITIPSAHSFTVHGHGCINSIMHAMPPS